VNAEIELPEMGPRFGYYFLAEGLGSIDRSQSSPDAFVMKSVTESLLDAPIEILARKYSQFSDKECESAIRAAFQDAHRALRDIAANSTGVTISGALIRGSSITYGYVGANRLYWIDRNTIQALIRGHLVFPMMPPHDFLLYSALGLEQLTIDVSTHKNISDGYLLLCTWRIWDSVSDGGLRDVVMTSNNLENACNRLLNRGRKPFDDRGLALIIASYTKFKPYTDGLSV
jgi:serine/threonine protein phosphatase PrpC